jgi:hypothetical protein
MTNTKYSILLISLLSSLVLSCVVGCGDVKLTPYEAPPAALNAESKGAFCTFDPEKKISYTNYLFIMDYSGSNGQNDSGGKRVKKTQQFFDSKKSAPYTRWGGIGFGTEAQAFLNDGNKEKLKFSENIAQAEDLLKKMKAKGNASMNETNYERALSLARNGISEDLKAHPDRDDYYVLFFLSDGDPTVGEKNTPELVKQVEALVGLKKSRIYLSTVFYGKGGRSASFERMEKMAQAGKGKFVQIENAENINFDQLLPVGESKEPWVLKDDAFMVYNLNSAICESMGNRFDTDSDGDGLCDKDELKFGYDPTKRSTKDNGYSDYFQNFERQGLLILPKCKAEDHMDLDHDLLNGCEEKLIQNENPVGTKDPTGFIWKVANPLDPDTDNDGLIDGIEVVLFRSHLGWALDDRVDKDWDYEGISAFRQAQMHKNPLEEDPDSKIYDTRITKQEATQNGRSCFDFAQSLMPLYYDTQDVLEVEVSPMLVRESQQNSVLVYFIQNKFKDPTGKGIYMWNVQNLQADPEAKGSSIEGLVVRDDLFNMYKTFEQF